MLFQENNNYRRPVFHLLYSFLFSNAYSDYQHISIPLLIFNTFVFFIFIFVPYLVEIVSSLYPSLPADLASCHNRDLVDCKSHACSTLLEPLFPPPGSVLLLREALQCIILGWIVVVIAGILVYTSANLSWFQVLSIYYNSHLLLPVLDSYKNPSLY